MSLSNKIKCPFCGSYETSKMRHSAQAMAISILFLGFPILFFSKIYHCFDCGNDFKTSKDSK